MTVMTIGHSVLTFDAFLALLRAHHVTAVADVRRIPASRRHPHFTRAALAASLASHGIGYEHFEGLGGRRHRAGPEGGNQGWQHSAFRAYADYMATPAFAEALDALIAFASHGLVAVMCAEGPWWRCHRRLVADALLVRGHDVRHIMSARPAAPHVLTPFARVEGERISYPAT